MKILLIDDDEKCLKSVGKALLINGFPNRQFSNPIDAIDAFKSERFDVVVTDLKMPEMNGIEVLKAIRSLDPSVFVIILTAYDDYDSLETALKNGAYSFFHKSVDFNEFFETISLIEKRLDNTEKSTNIKNNILLIEDNRLNAELVINALETFDYNVIHFDNAKDGIESISNY